MKQRDLRKKQYYWIAIGRKRYRMRYDGAVPGGLLFSENVEVHRYKDNGTVLKEIEERTITIRNGGQVLREAPLEGEGDGEG